MGRPSLVAVAIVAALAAGAPVRTCAANETFVSLGTGEMDGLYYPIGKAICKVAGLDLRAMEIRCSPETTPGSVYNVDAVESGELELGLAQTDVAREAYRGIGPWQGRAVSDLRSVLSLHSELVTIIARADANIHSISDLAGKRVNVGSRGTGTRATWDSMAAELGRERMPTHLMELRADEAKSALCNGDIDANLLIVGHPSPSVAQQLTACPTNFVAIDGAFADKLLQTHPLFVRGSIPAELYGISRDIPTVSSRAMLVTSGAMDARIIAPIAKTILTRVSELRTLHPALARLTVERMVQPVPAPLHPAAVQVYNELGLLK
jgi:TRAP transporter TAXI family solute receptor